MVSWKLVISTIAVLLCSLLGVSLGATCGTWTGPSGTKYNLDPLSKSVDYIGTEEGTAYTYYYNFCQNIVRQTSCVPAPAVQVSNTGSCTPVGLLPAAMSEISNGIKIVYTNNNDLCGNPKSIPRVSTFLITCTPNVEYTLVSIKEPGVCQYEFSANSKYACAGGSNPKPPSGGGSSSSLSGGSIFLIIFFVTVAVYLLVGMAVKWKVYSATGVELIPNTDLWLGLPGLVADGFLFIKNKITGAVGYSAL
jgi:hypothetical protein